LGRAKKRPAPERLKIILEGICDNPAGLDPRIATLFDEIVYIVLNHPPLSSQRQERHFVAAMNLNRLAEQTKQHLRVISGHLPQTEKDFACELLFFGQPSEPQLEQAASWLWQHKWLQYWGITVDWEESRRWYTWNQLLLKGDRPVPIGMCWQSPIAATHKTASAPEPQPPYLYVSSDLSAEIGLPDPNPSTWFEQLLTPVSKAVEERVDYPSRVDELYPLRDIFNHIDPKGFTRTTELAAWSVTQLARYYACWGGQAFISIPVVIGALGFYRVAVLSICTSRPLDSLAYREWKLIAGAIFRPMIEEEMVNLVRHRDLARVTYSIGHSLKSRYRGVIGKIEALCQTVKDKLGQDSNAQAIASIALERSESCQRTAEMMNFMSALLYTEDGSPLRKEFLCADIYPIASKLREQSLACNEAQKRIQIELDGTILKALTRTSARIQHCSRSKWSGRIFDPFYDEILFEILLNAAQHNLEGGETQCTVTTEIKRSVIPENTYSDCMALVFTTCCHNPDVLVKKGFAAGKWRNCIDGHEGGLRFMADCLDIASLGAVHARLLKQRTSFVFQTHLTLVELTIDEL
jgi:hypothetical protein